MDITINLTKRRNEFGEYVVKVREDGRLIADYHSDCYDDALGTAMDMSRRYRKAGHSVQCNL